MTRFEPKSRYKGRVMAREISFYQCVWVTKICAKFGRLRSPRTDSMLSPVKIRIFCPKPTKFDLKLAFFFILGQALPAHLVGGCGARAVSRNTPNYFI